MDKIRNRRKGQNSRFEPEFIGRTRVNVVRLLENKAIEVPVSIFRLFFWTFWIKWQLEAFKKAAPLKILPVVPFSEQILPSKSLFSANKREETTTEREQLFKFWDSPNQNSTFCSSYLFGLHYWRVCSFFSFFSLKID